MMEQERNCLVAICSCGGWVMVAALGNNAECDKDAFIEAGKLAAEGFTVRTPISLSECRSLPMCEHQGDCITNPETVRVGQEEMALEVAP